MDPYNQDFGLGEALGRNEIETSSIEFSVLTQEEILKLSVKKISTSLTFDQLGYPINGGLYDLALGPLLKNVKDQSDPCATCHKNVYQCPGHFGHYELPVICVNPLFYSSVELLLKTSCMTCYQLQFPLNIKKLFILQMKLIQAGYIIEAQEISNYMLTDEENDKESKSSTPNQLLKKYHRLLEKNSKNEFNNKNIESVKNSFVKNLIRSMKLGKKCRYCSAMIKKISTSYHKIMIYESLEDPNSSGHMGPRMIMADESQQILRKIYGNDHEIVSSLIPILAGIKSDYPTDIMFINVLPILPSIVRPVNYLNNQIVEHPQTQLYKYIIECSLMIRYIIQLLQSDGVKDEKNVQIQQVLNLPDLKDKNKILEKFHNQWQELQTYIDFIMDTSSTTAQKLRNKCEGIKQIIEKKTGIIRQHMMGKRVNYAARSVITPDPNININEVGIPLVFAKQLTYPVRVTTYNVNQLREMIKNGPDQYPGAVMVENEDGVLKLIPQDPNQKESIAKRLLVATDEVILKGNNKNKRNSVKIIHRHLLNGDVVLLNRQPTLHKPSIQGHHVRILNSINNDKTIRLHYGNCKAYNADFDGDEMNIHLPQNELSHSEAINIVNVSNQYLVPKDGTPLCGLIQDHIIAGVKLTIRDKLFNKFDYQQFIYHALSSLSRSNNIKLLSPCIVKPQKLWSGKQIISTILINLIPTPYINFTSQSKIRHFNDDSQIIIRNGELISGILDKQSYGATPYSLIHAIYELYGGDYSTKILSAFSKLFTLYLQCADSFTLGVADILVKNQENSKRDEIINELRDEMINKQIVLKSLNSSETDPLIDEDELKLQVEKSLVLNDKYRMILDREYKHSLDKYTNKINKALVPNGLITSYPDNNLQLMINSGAKGSMVNSMQISCLLGQIELEGKRPPLMISGKSLPSFIPYDFQPRAGGFIDQRFMTGIQPQEFFFHCMAGREGLIDTAVKTSRSGYLQRCLVKHLEGLTVQYDLTVRDSDNSIIQFLYGEDGMDICKAQYLKDLKYFQFLDDNKEVFKNFDANIDEEIKKYLHQLKTWDGKNRKPDPIISKYQPDHYFGALNENMEALIKKYTENKKHTKEFSKMIKAKCQQTLTVPGEPVGMLAAQSIGEPSTQMTLNTFHFAGRGDMNVTLGIPRLREILMTASKEIKTPNMVIPINSNFTDTDAIANLCKKLTRCTLDNILNKIHIKSKLNVVGRNYEYQIKFHFLPHKLYSNQFYIRRKYVMNFMEKKFFPSIFNAIYKAAHIKTSLITATLENDKPKKKSNAEEDEEVGNNENDANFDAEEMNNEDKEQNSDDDSESENEEESKFKRNKYSDDESEDENVAEDNLENTTVEKNIKTELTEDDLHRSKVVDSLNFVTDYKYDQKSKQWCELTFTLPLTFKNIDIQAILKDLSMKSIIWQTPLIKRAITYKDEQTQELILRTDGININEMFKYNHILNLNKLYTNDIHKMADVYGIEAAACVIRKEIKEVFGVYGINVDYRHLSLISDYMTYNGIYQPMSRTGMEDSISPLQQMSFEKSLGFLKNAITFGKYDYIQTPSSCLMLGSPSRVGTNGSFSIIHDITKYLQ
ncbi:DNA-directed RNA polymerase I subunit RPA1 [Chrysoperla carnea]|uniref:DNA-directed RNA polymerase I subunit RPA1 n=1 Tax=Chrysoperla carnea TaxID=189513 RepID=UPI001D067565|nr:DNA-directed RNA polymerase I subunit RPA1 [Chrysoperla carnea]